MNAVFSKFSNAVASAMGRPIAFILALATVCLWAASGPIFDYSETWQLVINTGTTIVTFLMIFVLQNSQNRDGKALQAKLDELILTSKGAHNKFIGIERLGEDELRELRTVIDQTACEVDDEELNSTLEDARRKLKATQEAQATD
jgi:low affinity Fe/Cu permease